MITVERKVEFETDGGVRLCGDLYRPRQRGNVPILIALHGGGWKQGSADQYRYWGEWLAQRDYGLFAINYRLVDGTRNRFPAALDDVLAAVRFVRRHAADWGVDAARLGLIGDSAGAHLAVLAALTGNKAESHSADSSLGSAPIKAVVGVYGVYDLLAQWEHDLVARPRDSITEALIGVSPLDSRMPYIEASPTTYATSHARLTSFLICWGTDDDVVDWKSQSWRLLSLLKQAGCYVRTAPIVGAPHFWMRDPIDVSHSFTARLAPKLLQFLECRL